MRLIPFATSSRSSSNPKLYSDRLVLERPSFEHFGEWASLRQQSAAFLTPWEPKWAADEFTKAAYRARLRHQEAQINSGRGLYWYLKDRESSDLLGGISISNIRRGIADCGTLGYWMGEPYAGMGFMTEAVLAVCKHAFGAEKLHRIEASTVLDNERSQRLLATCGFEREGKARAYLKINNEWRDHYLFAKLSSDSTAAR